MSAVDLFAIAQSAMASEGQMMSMKKGRPALPGAKLPATSICLTWPTASPSRKIEAALMAAALNSRSRQFVDEIHRPQLWRARHPVGKPAGKITSR